MVIISFSLELSDIIKEEIEFKCDKISIDALGEIDIKPAILSNLDWLIK